MKYDGINAFKRLAEVTKVTDKYYKRTVKILFFFYHHRTRDHGQI